MTSPTSAGSRVTGEMPARFNVPCPDEEVVGVEAGVEVEPVGDIEGILIQLARQMISRREIARDAAVALFLHV